MGTSKVKADTKNAKKTTTPVSKTKKSVSKNANTNTTSNVNSTSAGGNSNTSINTAGSNSNTTGNYNNSSVNNNNVDLPRDKNRYKYRIEIQQMMFVSGETNDPPERTTELIEDIVKDQVVWLILHSQRTANARGQRSILPEDVIFLIRHDKAKVNRLRTYLSWKDVRKNAKEQENGDLAAAAAGGELIDESGAGGSGGTNGSSSAGVEGKMLARQKKSQIRLPWELEYMFNEQPLIGIDEEKVDEEERDAVLAQIKRLKQNDERTKNMTQKEYVHWSECRQASFTFRKSKRFREWCGMSQIAESRPNDDVIDILGFLTFEMVCSITEEALRIKNLNGSGNNEEILGRRRYLFDEPSNDSKPIQVEHIQEAWRNLQDVPRSKKALYNFKGGRIRRAVKLI